MSRALTVMMYTICRDSTQILCIPVGLDSMEFYAHQYTETQLTGAAEVQGREKGPDREEGHCPGSDFLGKAGLALLKLEEFSDLAAQ